MPERWHTEDWWICTICQTRIVCRVLRDTDTREELAGVVWEKGDCKC